MPRQTLAERIAAALLSEAEQRGLTAEPLHAIADEDFEALAMRVQEALDEVLEHLGEELHGNGQKGHKHLRRKRDSGAPQERGEPRAERRGKHR